MLQWERGGWEQIREGRLVSCHLVHLFILAAGAACGVNIPTPLPVGKGVGEVFWNYFFPGTSSGPRPADTPIIPESAWRA